MLNMVSGSMPSASRQTILAKPIHVLRTLRRTHLLKTTLEHTNALCTPKEKILSSAMCNIPKSEVVLVRLHIYSVYVLNFHLCSEQAEPGKPPPGYKCRRCESSEVILIFYFQLKVYIDRSLLSALYQRLP